MKSEALLPDTDAITKGTIEIVRSRGKMLVRYKRIDGNTSQKTFSAKGSTLQQSDIDEVFEEFLLHVHDLRMKARSWQKNKV